MPQAQVRVLDSIRFDSTPGAFVKEHGPPLAPGANTVIDLVSLNLHPAAGLFLFPFRIDYNLFDGRTGKRTRCRLTGTQTGSVSSHWMDMDWRGPRCGSNGLWVVFLEPVQWQPRADPRNRGLDALAIEPLDPPS